MKQLDIRVVVQAPNGARSATWRFWSWKNDVYAAHRELGGTYKFSFHPARGVHQTNVCRLARPRVPTPDGPRSQATHQWIRHETPPAGKGLATRVLRIGFATDLLSLALKGSTREKPVIKVEAAPSGGSTVLDLLFTRDGMSEIQKLISNEPPGTAHELVTYKQLPNGEAVCLTSWFAREADTGFTMPASHGVKDDLVVSTEDPMDTGRPVRLMTFSNPKDGELMRAWEFGAYWRTPSS